MNLSRLMGWLQNKMPNFPINNFTTDWKDGRKVSAYAVIYGRGDDKVYSVRKGRVRTPLYTEGVTTRFIAYGKEECVRR